MTNSNAEGYYFQKVFDWEAGDPKTIRHPEFVTAALNRAEEIRRFEIELYWRRALYFWGFNVAIFAGVGVFVTDSDPSFSQEFIGLLLAFLGLFVTIAWYCMSEGAKAWQENWEQHVYFLEGEVTGNLMKSQFIGKNRFMSVSKINQTVIFAIGLFWVCVVALLGSNLILDIKGVRQIIETDTNPLLTAGAVVAAFVLIVLWLVYCKWPSDINADCNSCSPCASKAKRQTQRLYRRPLPEIDCCKSDQ